MKGTEWNGERIDLTKKLGPFLDAMNLRKKSLNRSGRTISTQAGHTLSWYWELTGTKGMRNPNIARLARWVQLLGGQEFGLHLTTDTGYGTYPVFDMDEPPPWTFRGSRQIPDLRQHLTPLGTDLRRQRRYLFRSTEAFAATLPVGRSGIANLESGAGLTNPTLGRLTTWARHVEAEGFGVYVLIDGQHTAAELVGDTCG